ncbi:hypothetical protein HanXRQr2_Chr17g0820601 [Helianthus annuus]|uniref:Uncharacterized protein n=1 Tax=Helianthus annuus TaxID=4232 RepID=A0A9K3DKU1_HELAN|nr:hypothetical protein HanXRQr2_Chr17g0820601 [Helianthus annuus]
MYRCILYKGMVQMKTTFIVKTRKLTKKSLKNTQIFFFFNFFFIKIASFYV